MEKYQYLIRKNVLYKTGLNETRNDSKTFVLNNLCIGGQLLKHLFVS